MVLGPPVRNHPQLKMHKTGWYRFGNGRRRKMAGHTTGSSNSTASCKVGGGEFERSIIQAAFAERGEEFHDWFPSGELGPNVFQII